MNPHSRLRKNVAPVLLSVMLSAVVGLLALHFTFAAPAASNAGGPATPPTVVPRREIGGGDAATISYIDSPSATCYLPAPGTGACYIAWSYLNVAASSGNYIITMTVSIDDQLRAYHAGFFQNAMYVPGTMIDPGFKVTCGEPSSGGNQDRGNTYSYAIRARETGGLNAANYGSVTCPADEVHLYAPMLKK
jgi:hypothetical protein